MCKSVNQYIIMMMEECKFTNKCFFSIQTFKSSIKMYITKGLNNIIKQKNKYDRFMDGILIKPFNDCTLKHYYIIS